MRTRATIVPLALMLGFGAGCSSAWSPGRMVAEGAAATTLTPLTPEEVERATLADSGGEGLAVDWPDRREAWLARSSADYSGPPLMTPAEFAEFTAEDPAAEQDRPAMAARGASLRIVAAPAAAPKKFEITLRNTFVEKYKNRVTLTTTFQVMGASGVHGVGSGGDDGDVHCGGIADEAGLPCVAEVMNAKGNQVAKDMKDLAKDQEQVQVTGAWRK